MIQAAKVNTLIFESVEQAREAIKKSREAGNKKPNAADKINAKYDAELAALESKQTQPNIVKVYHHTTVAPQNFNFGNFQRGKDQISQFGDGLNAATTTNSFFVSRYGNPIEGEIDDSEFIVIDANKSQKEIYEMLVSRGFKFNSPQLGKATAKGGTYVGGTAVSEYSNTDPLHSNPGSAIDLFNDFQQSNPEVKGVKILNHIIGNQKVDPFYVIYDAKSFYGPGSLSKTSALEGQVEEPTTDWADIISKATERELDAIIDQIDKADQMTPELLDLITNKRQEYAIKNSKKGDLLIAKKDVFYKNKSGENAIFTSAFSTAVITKVDEKTGKISIKPLGADTEITLSINEINAKFNLKETVDTPEIVVASMKITDQDKSNIAESSDNVDSFANNAAKHEEIQGRVESKDVTIEDLDDDVLNDLEC